MFESFDQDRPIGRQPKGELMMELYMPDQPENPPQKMTEKYKEEQEQGPKPPPKKIQQSEELNQHQFKENVDNRKLFAMHLKLSQRKLNQTQKQMIGQTIKKTQKNVFISQTTNNKAEYLGALYSDIPIGNNALHKQIHNELHSVEQGLKNDIKGSGRYSIQKRKIPHNKDDLKELEKLDKYRLIKIKEGQVKSNVSGLRNQIQEEYYRNKLKTKFKIQDIVEKNYYSIDHPRTKQAQDFIKSIKQRRNQQKQQLKQYQTIKQQQLQKKKYMEEEEKYLARMQKKNKLKEYYESKLQTKLIQREEMKQKRQEYKEWMKQYQRQKPLQLQRQEEYRMKVLIPELQEKHKRLMTIKAERRPIDPQDIMEHQIKYLQFKKDDRIRKKAELQMIREQDDLNREQLSERLYKGKYRYLVLQSMIQQKNQLDPRQVQLSKKNRMIAYAEQIRSYQKQKFGRSALEGQTISNKKFVRRVRNMNGSLTISNRKDVQQGEGEEKEVKSQRNGGRKAYQQLNPYQDGINNLKYLKNKVREYKAKEEQNKPMINFVEQIQIDKPKSFLQEQREKRQKKSSQNMNNPALPNLKETQVTDITTNDQIVSMKAKAKHLDQKINRNDKQLRMNGPLQDNSKIQGEFVDAIKAKINIMNNFN